MYDPQNSARDVEQADDLPLEHEQVAGTSGSKRKSDAGNPPLSSADADDSELLSYWATRLQVLTVLSAFLSSMDGAMFSLTALQTGISQPASTITREVIYSCLAGALIFHVSATILAYIASFTLIRYRIVDEDIKLETAPSSPSGFSTTRLVRRVPRKIVLEPIHPTHSILIFLYGLNMFPFIFASGSAPIPPLPFSLMTRCFYTTICLAALGFVLALTGILTYVWAALNMPVGIFATVCLGTGVGAGIWAIFI